MTIYIRAKKFSDQKSFQQDVLRALKRLCPCYTYELGKKVSKKLGGSKDKQSWFPVDIKKPEKEKLCTCYCKNKAGCNLLEDIADSKTDLPITLPPKKKRSRKRKGSEYDPKKNKMTYNPEKERKIDTNLGKKKALPEMKFIHELIHALDDFNGKAEGDLTDAQARALEENAVRGTNQIRADKNLGYHRTTHKKKAVPNPTKKVLDEKNRKECECP